MIVGSLTLRPISNQPCYWYHIAWNKKLSAFPVISCLLHGKSYLTTNNKLLRTVGCISNRWKRTWEKQKLLLCFNLRHWLGIHYCNEQQYKTVNPWGLSHVDIPLRKGFLTCAVSAVNLCSHPQSAVTVWDRQHPQVETWAQCLTSLTVHQLKSTKIQLSKQFKWLTIKSCLYRNVTCQNTG